MDSLPPWELVRDLLRTLILPSAGVSAIILTVALLCGGTRIAGPSGQLIAGALALVAGMVAGNFFRGLLPWWSNERGWPALLSATLAVSLATILAACWRSHLRPGREFVLRSIVLVAAAYWLAPADSSGSRWGYLALIAAAGLANFEVMQRLVRPALIASSADAFQSDLLANREDFLNHGGHGWARIKKYFSSVKTREIPGLSLFVPFFRLGKPRAQLPLALAVIWGGSAATILVAAQSARFSEMAVLLAASLFPVGLAALGGKLDAPQLLVAPSVFIPALMLNGQVNTYSQVPFASFLFVAFAPCVLLGLRLPAVQTWPALARATALPCALLLPCALGVFLALRAEPLDFSGH